MLFTTLMLKSPEQGGCSLVFLSDEHAQILEKLYSLACTEELSIGPLLLAGERKNLAMREINRSGEFLFHN